LVDPATRPWIPAARQHLADPNHRSSHRRLDVELDAVIGGEPADDFGVGKADHPFGRHHQISLVVARKLPQGASELGGRLATINGGSSFDRNPKRRSTCGYRIF